MKENNFGNDLIRQRYRILKEEALEMINNLSGDIWNEYGLSDPGITILEQLCYSLIDLEYRMSFPIEDILFANKDSNYLDIKKSFYNAEEILPSHPWSKYDFMRIIVDEPGIKNVKIFESDRNSEVTGCYRVYLALEDKSLMLTDDYNTIVSRIEMKLKSSRNICEDFLGIELLKAIELYIEIEIDLESLFGANICNQIVGELLFKIQDFFVPFLPVYSLSAMVYDKQISVEQIYSGPLSKHGFIDLDEWREKKIKEVIYSSELLDIAIGIAGVKSLRCLNLYNFESKVILDKVVVDAKEMMQLNIANCKVLLYYNGLPIEIKKSDYTEVYKNLMIKCYMQKRASNDEEINYREGVNRDLSNYLSLQHDLPMIYGVGELGPQIDGLKSKVSSNQLKSFLVIFDQLFANAFANIFNLKGLLAVQFYSNVKKKYFTQLPNDVPNLNSVLKLLSTSVEDNSFTDLFQIQKLLLDISLNVSPKSTSRTKLKEAYSYVSILNNRGRVQDERISKYLDFMLNVVSEKIHDNVTSLGILSKGDLLTEAQMAKTTFLNNYIRISCNKNKAKSFIDDLSDENISSSIELRISKLLNIKSYGSERSFVMFLKSNLYKTDDLDDPQIDNRLLGENKLSRNEKIIYYESKIDNVLSFILKSGLLIDNYDIVEDIPSGYSIRLTLDTQRVKSVYIKSRSGIRSKNEARQIIDQSINFIQKLNIESEGFFFVEHIMLRTQNEINVNNDPYSFIVTIVLPNWPARFQSADFREFFYKTISENLPAHIYPNILWLDIEDMELFEKSYHRWVKLKMNNLSAKDAIDDAAKNLLGIIILFSNNDVYRDMEIIRDL